VPRVLSYEPHILKETTMKSRMLPVALLSAVVFTAAAFAADSTPAPTAPTAYGWQLMTPQERMEMRTKMRSATTVEEREQLRTQHHALMLERAKDQGVTLPEQPLAMGMGRGCIGGPGMGPRWQ
jgi:hypothetical protein